jgi:hypothetical protein
MNGIVSINSTIVLPSNQNCQHTFLSIFHWRAGGPGQVLTIAELLPTPAILVEQSDVENGHKDV